MTSLPGWDVPWTGGQGSPNAFCVLAPNPGPMTLDGTNTWILHRPGESLAVVVDPGPDDEGHLTAVRDAVEARSARVGVVLLTHGHADHSAGAARFARMCAAEVRALDPAHRLGSEGLGAGDRIRAGDLGVEVVGTPGHTADSLTFVLTDDAAVLTGDTVLGRGTSVVAHPDGRLRDYLDSLERLRRLADGGVRRVLPGHGPVLSDLSGVVDAYVVHRQERLTQVRAAFAEGHSTPAAVVAHVYADVPRLLWPAAELSVRAQLDYLADQPGEQERLDGRG
jgi:glyoxylase-like metal-dependent hydrolase (beta-lactamase superfamily II)